MRYLYHITDIQNIENIKNNGLKGDMKFLFKDATITNMYHYYETSECCPMTVRDSIARDQLNLCDKYAIFRVDISSIRDTLEADNVAEFTAQYQFFTRSEITSDMVKFIGIIPNQLTRGKYETQNNLPIQSLTKRAITQLDDSPL